jgi:hypothetical protein
MVESNAHVNAADPATAAGDLQQAATAAGYLGCTLKKGGDLIVNPAILGTARELVSTILEERSTDFLAVANALLEAGELGEEELANALEGAQGSHSHLLDRLRAHIPTI